MNFLKRASKSVGNTLAPGLHVENTTPVPILFVLSQVSPLHWVKIGPGEKKHVPCGRVWFTTSIEFFNEDVTPSARIVGLKIATIAAAQQEAGGVSAAGGHMKDAATGLSTITSYKGVKADGIYADGKALKISATATGMEGVYQFVIDQGEVSALENMSLEDSNIPFACQRHLFSLEHDVVYLNNAAYGPVLNSSKAAGIQALDIKCNPQHITAQTHFEGTRVLQEQLTTLVNADDPDRIAIIPAASYGMAIVAANVHRIPNISSKKHIVILENEFPNDTYAFSRVLEPLNLSMKVVTAGTVELGEMGEVWNTKILDSITPLTALVVVPHVHWVYGVVFDLLAISNKCKAHGALLVVDGSQSVGAFPFDVAVYRPDALIVPAYKWCLGPYGLGFAYFGSFFDDGVPVEETWMNRLNSDKFSELTNLQTSYRPKAQRYNMGEFSMFENTIMLQESLKCILNWSVVNISAYCKTLSHEAVEDLQSLGCEVVSDSFRAPHLFGIKLPDSLDATALMAKLKEKKVFVSLRGGCFVRLSVNVFNSSDDISTFISVLEEAVQLANEHVYSTRGV